MQLRVKSDLWGTNLQFREHISPPPLRIGLYNSQKMSELRDINRNCEKKVRSARYKLAFVRKNSRVCISQFRLFFSQLRVYIPLFWEKVRTVCLYLTILRKKSQNCEFALHYSEKVGIVREKLFFLPFLFSIQWQKRGAIHMIFIYIYSY